MATLGPSCIRIAKALTGQETPSLPQKYVWTIVHEASQRFVCFEGRNIRSKGNGQDNFATMAVVYDLTSQLLP
jgi:hypothetical protein